MENRIKMGSKDFISKIIRGEREFSNISLRGCDFDEDFYLLADLCLYFKEKESSESPERIILEDSDLSRIRAKRLPLWLPNLSAKKSIFKGAKIPRANLSHGIFLDVDFTEAYAPLSNFEYSTFNKVKLNNSNFSEACFDHANLRDIEAYKCDFDRSSFYGAVINGMMGLDTKDSKYARAFYNALRTTAKKARGKEIFSSNDIEHIEKNILEIIHMGDKEKELIRSILEREFREPISVMLRRGIETYFKGCIVRFFDYRI